MKKYFYITLALALISIPALKGKELTLASYNIRHGADIHLKLNLDATAATLKNLNADIIALQEVDQHCTRSNNIDQAQYLAKKLGMHHAFGQFMPLQGGAYGMAILSKFPILKIKSHRLPTGGEPRVALEIIVELTPGNKASFVCIHFDWTSEKRRHAQIKTLLTKLNSVTHPLALMGDFNATPQSSSIALFKKPWINVPKKGTPFTYPADNPQKEIDYFMLRGFPGKHFSCTVVPETKASDHRPIVMKVTFPSPSNKHP